MEKLTAQAILAIQDPCGLFSAPENAKPEYVRLAVVWHPDCNSNDVVAVNY